MSNTVSVDDQLEYLSEVISLQICWPSNVVVVVSYHAHGGENGQLVHDMSFHLSWSPEVANESCILNLHLIEDLIHGFLFGQEHLVNIQRRYVIRTLILCVQFVENFQLISQRCSGLHEYISCVINSLRYTCDLRVHITRCWHLVSISCK